MMVMMMMDDDDDDEPAQKLRCLPMKTKYNHQKRPSSYSNKPGSWLFIKT